MLLLKTRADLERLVEEGLQESLTLEYKASSALQKTSEARAELVKDVTAFANSAGGQIIYGISERKGGIPQGIDAGVDAKTFSPEWLGQVIETNSAPRIQGLQIETIVLSQGNPTLVAYVLSIPAAVTFAPHQNSIDMKYYRRFESRSVPMHDYEIRDVLRRGKSPELSVNFLFADGGGKTKDHRHADEVIEIEAAMQNLSPEPALYSLFEFYFQSELIIVETGAFRKIDPNLILEPFALHRLQKSFITPPDFPMLKGSSVTVGPPRIAIRIPRDYFGKPHYFAIGYSASTVGFSQVKYAGLLMNEGALTISDFFTVDEAARKLAELKAPAVAS
ncbi:AlbA family DNA-binding domain-containing protein [Bradyrhizobium erythrophlei]|jgi:Putative DNA-binding domain|uniref:Putative DNA-binding domain-containing protein n=1 Tax=Bradyrhizobium erythrophlei TaxID=1437360 RepID=A0A1M7TSR3_9BRAD|nr:ATP-binding protein [Bradyrhizobium erythrophlei]SHN73794.1 Putative DNA-binding domain-containing protein [Bradyrhizobium erythrophlei]